MKVLPATAFTSYLPYVTVRSPVCNFSMTRLQTNLYFLNLQLQSYLRSWIPTLFWEVSLAKMYQIGNIYLITAIAVTGGYA